MTVRGKGSTQNVFAQSLLFPPPEKKICYLCAKRKGEQVKFVAPPKEKLLLFSIVQFLTMTSQIESIRSTQYTPLFGKGIKE